MPGYLTAAAKATSTVCLLWSAYLIARARAHRKRHITPVSDFDETSVIDSKRSDPFKACSLELDDPLHAPSFPLNADDRPHSVDTATRMFSLLHRSWSAVARLLYDASESSQLISPSQTFSMDKLSFYANFVTELAEKTNLTPEPSFGRKVGRLYSPTRSRTMLTEELLRRLVTYTKSDEFLNILLRDSRFPGLLEFLIRLTLSSYHPPAQPQEENPNVLFEQPSKSDESTAGSSHSQYPISLLVATILANASRNPWDTEELLKPVRPEFDNLLSMWCNSSSLQLLLLGSKIRYNLDATHTRVSKSDDAEPTRFRPVYYPDIFRLDKLGQSCESDPEKDECDLDVVFVHGMWGSVFYTWRQSEHPNKAEESTPSTCWPRVSPVSSTLAYLVLDQQHNFPGICH
ncbi:hypothetical protein FGIG_05459 [Fasciola gigantica]|uniref:Uncharacterized protein n=1 Tax=Fasciola gigantica TaxID=46835 RepID=A0A504YK65_FASGI|nr:hypothetical protein FGIG_05459 [Fasciola gigantica]